MKPKISFVTPMKERDFRVLALLKSIRNQNYPQNRIEIIITDGGSNPSVLDACKKYHVRIYENPKGFAEGAGMGKDQGIWHSTGKYVVIAESDTEYMSLDWINSMIKPLEEDDSIFASAPRLYIHPKDSLTNRYLSYIGVDPFAFYRALDAQLILNKKTKKILHKNYIILELDPQRPYCMGSNGFMFRRELTKKVGDYAQDIEFIARLAKHGHDKFAYVSQAPVWHKNVKGLYDFLNKRVRWTRNYAHIYIHEKKEYNWITDRQEFFRYILANLLIAPNIPVSIKKAVEYRDTAWLLHAPLLFFSTLLNVYSSLHSRKMFTQVFTSPS